MLARGKGAGEPAEDEWLQAIFGVKGSETATVQLYACDTGDRHLTSRQFDAQAVQRPSPRGKRRAPDELATDEDATAQRSKPKPVQTVAQPGSMPFIGEICENSATLAFSCI